MNAKTPLTSPVDACEPFRIAASALADGELPQDEVQALVDHLVVCAGCADFYRRARTLDAALLAVTVPAGGTPAPDAVWRRIVGRVDEAAPPVPLRRPSRVLQWLPVAAILALAIGLAFVRPERPGSTGAPEVAGGDAATIEVELEGDAGEMSDDRFVALTTELLQADRRYHRKMLEVMTVVSGRFEGEGESDEGAPPRLGSESRFTFRGGEDPLSRLERGDARL